MGNLDFTNHLGFSWYCLLLMASGVAMLAIGAVSGQARGTKIANLVAGAGFFGYGWYLTFLFQGGSYFVFFKAFILPALLIISGIRSIAATRQARARARATTGLPGSGGPDMV